VATLTLNGSQLAAGANNITAIYGGDTNYIGASSAPIIETLLPGLQNSFGSVNVGTAAPILSLTYNFASQTTLSAINILTAGASGLDYTDGGSSTCTAGTTYNASQSCVVTVAFTPSIAGLRPGAVVLFAQGSSLPLTTWYVSGFGQSAAVTIDPGTQSTIATLSNNGQAYGSAVDGAGNVYVADNANSRVLEMAAGSFAQTTIVSSGLLNPTFVAIDGAGNLYISDTGNSRVAMVPNEQGSLNSGDISTVSISGLGSPTGLATDASGDLFVADAANGNVVEVPVGNTASIVVSNLTAPQGIAVDAGGNLYVSSSNQLSEYPAGGGTPIPMGTGYNSPHGLTLDASGAIYVADSGNARIVRVAPGGASQTTLTVAGIIDPQGIAVDSADNVYVTDSSNVYELNRTQAAPLTFGTIPVGSNSPSQTLTMSSAGTQPLKLSNLATTANFLQVASGGSDCSSGAQLGSGTQCLVALQFAPAASGLLTGTFSFGDNSLGGSSTGTVQLSGSGLSTQTITFGAIPIQTYGGGPVSLNATASSGLPVSYAVINGPASVSGNLVSILGAGSVTVQASQAGNTSYAPATPVSQTFTVSQATQTITFSQGAPASAPYDSSFTVVATASSGLPVSLTSAGACSQSGTTFTITNGSGSCTVTANQSGNSNYLVAPVASESTTAVKATPTVNLSGVPATAPYESTFSVVTSSNSGATATITASGVCTDNGTNIMMTSGTGKCTVTARWATTQNYLAAFTSQAATAKRVTPVLTWEAPAPITYGTPLSATQLDATANVAGSFTYTPAEGTILGVGTHTLVAAFTPTANENYYSTSAKVSLVVSKTPTTTSILSLQPNPSEVGQAVTVQFSVTPASGYGTPTGRVKVSAQTGLSCSGTLTTNEGTCSLTFSSTGTKNLTATYSGDSNDSESASNVVSQVVN
jgi:sugar lactone lactonase YvrE